MLERLSNILKKTTDKIANAIFLDKNLIENIIMLIGLYGSGKTTTIGKLAHYYAKRGSKVCAIGLDVHRPAAAEQLRQVCSKLNIQAFIAPEEKDPAKIFKKYQKELAQYD